MYCFAYSLIFSCGNGVQYPVSSRAAQQPRNSRSTGKMGAEPDYHGTLDLLRILRLRLTMAVVFVLRVLGSGVIFYPKNFRHERRSLLLSDSDESDDAALCEV
ncbi:unnamed protein product [Gongylonema pulchrum]|uniref:Secreted protein n=1 Tax=Gongylonema pulchrum TaxID=637853 RepID=A0A183D5J4_9BILA|nr:unnamed protein product [Gongylonema pulchrum]